MNFSLKTEGLDECARALETMPDAVGKKIMREALKNAGEPIRGMAAAIMARGADAPHAAQNVVIHVGRSGFSAAIGPTKDFYYWLFQELGTVRHPAQPAMRPAFDSQAPNSLGIMGRELWTAIKGQAERNRAGVGGRFL